MEPSEERTVLVVDDTPVNIDVIRHILRGRYRIKAATSGRRALEVATKAPVPNLILLDIMLSDVDGYAVCRNLKEDPATRDIPVIFVSGKTGPETAAEGLGAGAHGFISKPVDPPTLLAEVADILGA